MSVRAVRVRDTVRFEGRDWRVLGMRDDHVDLSSTGVPDRVVPRLALLGAPDFAVLDGQQRRPLSRTPEFDALPQGVQDAAVWWAEQLTDVVDGCPCTGEGPNFDVSVTTLRQREVAKVAQLASQGREVSLRMLQRKRARFVTAGLIGLVDQRLLRRSQSGARMDPQAREALGEVLRDGAPRSTGTLERIRRDLTALLTERYGPGVVDVPSQATLYRVVRDVKDGRHALGSARTRRTLAQQPQRQFSAVHPTRPGEVVEVDSTPLDVAIVLDDGVLGRAELSGLVDVATRTVMAIVVRPTTKAVDLGALLARGMTPEPMRPGWCDTVRMARSALPYQALRSVDDRLENAAARPVIVPETIVLDHGKQYTSRAFEHACRTFGISIQPAHPDQPTDKPHVERTLQSVGTLFVQYLPGYLGSSVERRGKNAELGAVLSIVELQDLLDEWIVTHWQNRPHEGLRDPLTPGAVLSPNEMYAAMLTVTGYIPAPLGHDDFTELLPWAHRKIGSEGVKLHRRMYDAAALDGFRHAKSSRRDGFWEVRYDPYDVTKVFVRLPEGFAVVPWRRLSGAPTPFGHDVWRTAQEVLRERGITHPSEQELHEAADALLDRARDTSTTKHAARRAKRVRAKDAAARQARATHHPTPEASEPVAGPPEGTTDVTTEEQARPAEPDEAGEGAQDLAKVVPLPVYNAAEEAKSWW